MLIIDDFHSTPSSWSHALPEELAAAIPLIDKFQVGSCIIIFFLFNYLLVVVVVLIGPFEVASTDFHNKLLSSVSGGNVNSISSNLLKYTFSMGTPYLVQTHVSTYDLI